jgi:predicted Zn-ribbon and HTH transcriptional regulator
MGACYVDQTFEASDEATLKKSFADYADQERYENGHAAYSGVLNYGMRISTQAFKTIDEAQEYVERNTRKWETALAVKVGDFSKALFNTTKGNKLITQVNELQKKIENFDKDLLNKVATQKSLYKACNTCGSKISVKHFVKGNSTACPVCKAEFVKTAKDVERFNKLFADWKAKEKELQVLKKEYKEKMKDKKPVWYVGGWAAT